MTFRILLVDRAGDGLAALARAAREAGIEDVRLEHCETVHEAVGRVLDEPVDFVAVGEPRDGTPVADAILRLLCTAPGCPPVPLMQAARAAEGAAEGPEPSLLARTLARIRRHRQDQRWLVHRATHDHLTGLANRWLLEDKIGDAVARARRSGTPGALILIDLDGFKAINDRFGHDVGDLVLKTTADRLRGTLRECDTLARYGGDEFVALLDGVASKRAVDAVASKIHGQVADPIALPHGTISVTCSVGAALFPIQGEDLESLVRRADRIMYQRKRVSRTPVVA